MLHKKRSSPTEKCYANALDIFSYKKQHFLTIKIHGCNLFLLFEIKEISSKAINNTLKSIEMKIGESYFESLFAVFQCDSSYAFKDLLHTCNHSRSDFSSLAIDISIARDYFAGKKVLRQVDLTAAMDYINSHFHIHDKTAYDLVAAKIAAGDKALAKLVDVMGLQL